MAAQLARDGGSVSSKLFTLEALRVSKVVCLHYFTTIHPGHIRYLRHARALGDKFIIALIGDGETIIIHFFFLRQSVQRH